MTSIGALAKAMALTLLSAVLFSSSAGAQGSTTLTFEDALGSVADNAFLSAPAPATISGVTFTGPPNEPVYNFGKDAGTSPFTSDYFAFWTYGTGGKMMFANPIVSLSFKAGARDSLDNLFYVTVNGVSIHSFETNRFTPTTVSLTFNAPVTEVLFTFNSDVSSSSLLYIDDLKFATVVTFEDALGSVADNTFLSAPAPATISGVTFTGPPDEPVYNFGKDAGTSPFTSDYFAFWTYGTGGKMMFANPIVSLSFKAGARDSLDNLFYVTVNGVSIHSFETNRFTPTTVSLTFNAPVTEVLFTFNSDVSSSSLLYIDDLTFEIAGATPVGQAVEVISPVALPDGSTADVSLTFDNVGTSGTTSVTTSATGAEPPSGFKLTDPPVYYNITTTAQFTGSVRVCLSWSEGQIANENDVSLFHHEGGNWVNITDPASRDTDGNIVCGTAASLSPFTLFEVKYPFTGFFQPVDNLPVINSVKAGAAVPVKFSLGGHQGLNIFAGGYPRVQLIQCATGNVDAIEEIVTAGSSSLTYDATSGQYTYVWKTDKALGGSCRELQLKLVDGEVYKARFTFSK